MLRNEFCETPETRLEIILNIFLEQSEFCTVLGKLYLYFLGKLTSINRLTFFYYSPILYHGNSFPTNDRANRNRIRVFKIRGTDMSCRFFYSCEARGCQRAQKVGNAGNWHALFTCVVRSSFCRGTVATRNDLHYQNNGMVKAAGCKPLQTGYYWKRPMFSPIGWNDEHRAQVSLQKNIHRKEFKHYLSHDRTLLYLEAFFAG